MFELELKNQDELTIKAKERVVNINVVQSTVDAGLKVGTLVEQANLRLVISRLWLLVWRMAELCIALM